MLSYQRLAAAGGLVAAGPAGVPLSVYPEGMSAYLSGMGAEQASFYANPVSVYAQLARKKLQNIVFYKKAK